MTGTYKTGTRVQNRKGCKGVVVGDSGGNNVLVRYDDGFKDAWILRRNLVRVEQS